LTIYGIGGLGADKRVFNDLNLNYNFIPIDWIAPFKNENISDYANRLTKSKQLLDAILNDTDLNFTKWAVNELVVWNNRQPLKNVLKISGDADKVIPPKKKAEIKLINGGGHFMIVDNAEEISQIINEKVSKTIHDP